MTIESKKKALSPKLTQSTTSPSSSNGMLVPYVHVTRAGGWGIQYCRYMLVYLNAVECCYIEIILRQYSLCSSGSVNFIF